MTVLAVALPEPFTVLKVMQKSLTTFSPTIAWSAAGF
jgi:hypothetical protein